MEAGRGKMGVKNAAVERSRRPPRGQLVLHAMKPSRKGGNYSILEVG